MANPIDSDPESQFSERQRFDQAWLYILMVTTLVLPCTLAYDDYSKHGFSWPMLAVFIGPLLILVITRLMWLDVKVGADGIRYRFVPFIRWRLIPWASIQQLEVCKYDPLSDYGGWGVKRGKSGWIYNVSGEDGLRITHTDGHILMLGIKDVAGWKAVVANRAVTA
jgi:hypothetical protein